MMLQCWELAPENRPPFNTLYMDTSRFIERIAGYLEIGFNPFSAEKVVEDRDYSNKDEEIVKIPVSATTVT